MSDDERHLPGERGDDFWGDVPDWTDDPPRPRRERRETDITGAIKNLWGSAMTAGASATREHGVFDASAPRPGHDPDDPSSPVDPGLFDDIDHDLDDLDPSITTELPRVDARRRPTGDVPIAPFVERSRDGGRSGIDPLLARIGAVAVVTTLLVPLMMGLGSGDSDDSDSTAANDPAASAVTLPPATGEGEPAADESTSSLDPATLPPAIPARSDDETATAVETAQESGGETSRPARAEAPEAERASSSTASDDGDTTDTAESDSDGDAVAPSAADTEAVLADKVCAVDYVVQTGDYWIGLADGAGVPLAELLDANAATASTALYPGADICLPAGSATPTTTAAPTTTQPTTEPDEPSATAAPAPTPATAAPTTVAPTTTPPATTPAGPADIEQIIRDVWPDDLEDKALQIAYRESRYVPTARNYCCSGLFQIYFDVHQSWLAGIGVSNADQLFDPLVNARAAYALYQRAGGWGPWSQTNY